MTQDEPDDAAHESANVAVGLPASARGPSWRYIGDRAAADGAYCARFSVTEAPEPYVVPGGAWAYALPATRAS